MTPEQTVAHFAGIIRHSTVTKSSSNGKDQIAGRASSPTQGPAHGYNVRRLWPFGIRSVPVVGVDACVVFANGDFSHGLMVGAESTKYGPGDLVEGEVAIYSKQNPKIIWGDVNGATEIKAKAGQLIKIADGTDYEVLGSTFNGDLNTFLDALDTLNAALNTLVGALVVPTGVAAPAKATFAAASGVFAVALAALKNASYLSTVVKVG